PLAPIQCPDEIYIYDPRASGAVSFHRVDHEVGDPGPALPYGACHAWVRLVISYVAEGLIERPWPYLDEGT
ncbi:MAG: hypothetical protein PF961_03890, partial [Planctomycetota bacterium]|nr:hypothetical protein [Planctomycetota bacterium]